MEIIRTDSLCKSFGSTTAADHISMHVSQGEIYGFLGLNGAGKTTLIRMLLGMIKPDQGKVWLFGRELTRNLNLWNEVGYLVETPLAYPNLSVRENLHVYYALRQLKQPDLIDRIIGQLKLTAYKDKKASVLSLGNQQRLGLAKAMMHRPKLLILDEPINGLDPEGIVEVRKLLKELAEAGTTIFLSSHILGEISKIADRIGIIHEGKLIRELTVTELAAQVEKRLLVQTLDNGKAIECLTIAGFKAKLNDENELELYEQTTIAYPEKISKLLVEAGLPPVKIYVDTEDLEMYFLRTIRNHGNL